MEPVRLGWRIQNANQREADIDIFDVIGDPFMGTTARDFVQELRAVKNVERINLHVNSPGGFVNDALTMYNALQQHPAEVVAYVHEAASAASFVVQAADKRVIFKNSKMFIHEAHAFAMGNAADMRTAAERLEEESANIASIYADRSGKPAKEWRDAMQANEGVGTLYRGQDAVDAGLADEVMASPSRNLQLHRIAAQVGDELKEDDDPKPLISLPEDFGADFREAAVWPKPEPSLEALLAKQAASEPLTTAMKRS